MHSGAACSAARDRTEGRCRMSVRGSPPLAARSRSPRPPARRGLPRGPAILSARRAATAPRSPRRRRSSARGRCCRALLRPDVVRLGLRRRRRARFRSLARLLSPVPYVAGARRRAAWHTYVVLDAVGNCLAQHPRHRSRSPRSPPSLRPSARSSPPGRLLSATAASRRRARPAARVPARNEDGKVTFRQTVAAKGGSGPRSRRDILVPATRQIPLDLRQALRAADRRRRRAGLDLRPRSQPGDRAQARRRAGLDTRGAACRRRRRSRPISGTWPSAGRRRLRRGEAAGRGHGFRARPHRLRRQSCRARWSSRTRSATSRRCASDLRPEPRRTRRSSASCRRRAPMSSATAVDKTSPSKCCRVRPSP